MDRSIFFVRKISIRSMEISHAFPGRNIPRSLTVHNTPHPSPERSLENPLPRRDLPSPAPRPLRGMEKSWPETDGPRRSKRSLCLEQRRQGVQKRDTREERHACLGVRTCFAIRGQCSRSDDERDASATRTRSGEGRPHRRRARAHDAKSRNSVRKGKERHRFFARV